jgi:hypothetical protein
MGDKGGKKDKEKNKQQQPTKQKQEEQKKLDTVALTTETRCSSELKLLR